jgi:hypothetical protein
VPPAAADQLGAAAECLADRLVGEEDLLLDEEPGDVFPDGEREADDRDREQEQPQQRQQLSGDHAPEACRHAADRAEEAHAVAPHQLPHEDDHDRGDQRFCERPSHGFRQVGEGEMDPGASGGAVDAPPARQRFGEEVDPADDREGDQPDRHQRRPVAPVEPPRRPQQLAEGAPRPQLLEVDRSRRWSAGTAPRRCRRADPAVPAAW